MTINYHRVVGSKRICYLQAIDPISRLLGYSRDTWADFFTRVRGHPGLNRGPPDLQSDALPLSYTPWDTTEIHLAQLCFTVTSAYLSSSLRPKFEAVPKRYCTEVSQHPRLRYGNNLIRYGLILPMPTINIKNLGINAHLHDTNLKKQICKLKAIIIERNKVY